MTTLTQSKPWDFSHVLDLVSSLSPQAVTAREERWQDGGLETTSDETGTSPTHYTHRKAITGLDTPSAKLGDFGKVWQFLGTPLDLPAPEVPPLANEANASSVLSAKIDYTSDGAVYVKPARSGKTVEWQMPPYDEEPVTDNVTDRSGSPDTPTLTKTQRKKQRRRERKAQEAAEAMKNATVSESEADRTSRRAPARKASAHAVISDSAKRYNLRERDASGHAVTAPSPEAATKTPATPTIQMATARVAEKLAEIRNGSLKTQSAQKPATPINSPLAVTRQQSYPASSPAAHRAAAARGAQHLQPAPQWPVHGPSNAQAMQFVPSTVQPPAQSNANPVPAQSTPFQNQNVLPATNPKNVIEPKIVRSGEDRHFAMFMKLIADFWEDRKYLISPMNLTTHNNHPNGIHVFVDASNIFIGFTEQLKRSRGIHQKIQVPPVNLSFDALALLMERRRPVAKRVLVGSTPHLPAFDKAEAVGYECNILEKVYKARELTERQIYFKEQDRLGRHRMSAKAPPANTVAFGNASVTGGLINGNGSGGSGSASETNAPQYAPARMIEQGVDEILHLKILESVVDTEVPSTMVLATGDAAQAEYSQGFMAMAERALKKGWKVELVSWSKNISMMYSRKEWIETWGERFKVILLDDYAEELLEM